MLDAIEPITCGRPPLAERETDHPFERWSEGLRFRTECHGPSCGSPRSG
ncbi:hypothetical protein SLI_6056 [Streptomyces lividans 1326]|uniref:Uncharacterized protein n=1 Tax=Streptomyces lividans 1326 TaxID=1200984 RepID=A0A7U9HEG3_STRLI|nr:hypothetical protein SLI_6056 [Streptomyces lividans 1326]